MNRIILMIILFCSCPSRAQVFDMVIAKEGPDAYRTVQSAINHIPDYCDRPFRVFIKNGLYNEKVLLPASKTKVCLIGESAEGVIITYNDCSGKDGITTATSYTFWADAADLYAENITFQNSAGNVGQAVAIRTTGERQVFKNCRFLGFQDTYYAQKNRQYNLNCYVEGATDFIFGDATAVFDSCVINCVKGGQYITAPSDTKLISQKDDGSTFYHGLLIKRSVISGNSDVSSASYYLGRPWQPNASSVYMSCILGNHIRPAGWSIWSGTENHLSGFYGEYRNRNISGDMADTTSRVDWSHQISNEDASAYYSLPYFYKKQDVEWDPVPKTIACNAPSGLSGNGYRLTWSAGVPEEKGFVIIRNDTVIGFSDTTFYDDTTAAFSITSTYRIKSVALHGNLSQASDEYVISSMPVNEICENSFTIVWRRDAFQLSEPANITVYNLSGISVSHYENKQDGSLSGFPEGIYILKAVNRSGQLLIQKITR